MSDIDARLWRVTDRAALVLVLGVACLLIGLGPQPRRADSLYGMTIVLVVTVPAVVTIVRLPAWARSALRLLPRHRPLLTATAGLAGGATLLVAWWALVNALFPGTHSPLALALVLATPAGITTLLGRLFRRLRPGPAPPSRGRRLGRGRVERPR